MSDIQAGWVDLELSGERLTLKPTPAAMIAVSRHFGGFTAAIQKVAALDVDAAIHVVQQGAALPQDQKARKRLEADIFDAGVTKVATRCIEYLAVLQNGGRPLSDDLPDPVKEDTAGNG